MPERPPDPRDFPAFQNDTLRRIRELERQVLRLPDDSDPLQTYEGGRPLGDTRFLDFGDGVQGTLIGDDFVRITAAGGGAGTTWDAILDASIAATDTSLTPPVFKTNVNEALTYLDGLGLTRAAIFVRPGTYTETANFNLSNISTVALFCPTNLQNSNVANWNHSTFTVGSVSYVLTGLTVTTGVKGSMFLGAVTASNCSFDGASLSSPFTFSPSSTYLEGCVSVNAPMNWGTQATLVACQIKATSRSVTLASTWILMVDCIIGVDGTSTWTMPSRAYLSVHVESATLFGTTDSGILTLAGSSAGGNYFIDSKSFRPRISVVISSTPERVQLYGNFQDVTTPAQQNPFTLGSEPTRIDAAVADDLDVTGPADINIRSAGGNAMLTQIRGRGVRGAIARWDNGSSGAVVEFIDADQCEVNLALDGTSASGTRSPLSFDASSANNVAVLAGRSTFPAAYTDAGTNNRVLPEGTAAFSGISGHVVEDEGTPLTQRANLNFAGGGVTATDASPDTLVTIPGPNIPEALVDAKGDVITATADNTPVRKAVGADGTALVASAAAGDGLVWGTPAVLNFAAATTLGTVVGKVEIFDGAGVSLGFLPVYDAIT